MVFHWFFIDFSTKSREIVGVDQDRRGDSVVERAVGKISGVIVQATGLQQKTFTGVRLVDMVPFEPESHIDEHCDDEEHDDGPEGGLFLLNMMMFY